ncbi:MAG: sensor domain-containing diguanylate cyclase [Candidatus Omnitrophica bacterium]|nr:sensor domain-containing diguanylate cyclase [Candidatus Omnitrophota bacterium]
MEPINLEGRVKNSLDQEGRFELDDIVHSMKSGLYAADNEGNISFANRAFAEMFRFESEQDVLGVNLADQFYLQRNDRAAFLRSLNEKGFISDYRIQMVRRDGSRVAITAQSNFLKNKKGKIVGVEGILKELSEEKIVEENKILENSQISSNAGNPKETDSLFEDSLTGLYNYQYFLRCLDFEVKRTNRFFQPLCAIMIDIDNFHSFVDKYGQDSGDDLLKKAGVIFKNNFRDTDIVCRQSRDQFLAILSVTTRSEAMSIAKKVKDALQKTMLPDAATCSMGISRYILGMSTQELLLKTNLGLCMAKEMGKNEACFYG